MHDSLIVSSCIESRAAYEKVYKHVDTMEFSPLAAHLWPLVEEWYATDNAALAVNKEVLREKLSRVTEEKHRDTHLSYLDALPDPVSPANVVQEVIEVKRFHKGHELAQAVAAGDDPSKIRVLLHDYDVLLASSKLDTSQVRYASSLEEMDESSDNSNKLSLHPPALNDKCDGGLLPGDFVVIFARPEMGKTLFCVNLVSHWLREGKKILYIGNEDGIDKIKGRVRLNLANMTAAEVRKWKGEANERARARGIEDRLVAIHLHPGTVYEIEELVLEHEPDVLVIDQLRNINGEGKNMSSKLNQVAIDVRQLLSKHQLIGLAVAQANAGEHGKAKVWHDSGDVDESRTGIPAQADLLIGMGADNQMLMHNNRALALCKNKLSGNHEGIIVSVDTARNKIL